MILCSYITDNKIPELPVELARCQRLEVLHAGVNLIKEVDPQLFRGPAPGVPPGSVPDRSRADAAEAE